MAALQGELEAAGLAGLDIGPLRYRGDMLLGWTLAAHRA